MSANFSNATFQIDTFLLENLGQKRQDLYIVIPMTFVYCVIFLTGVIGNISTCIVIARNLYMHTPTNFYLVNLALSDLLMLMLGLPLETYTFWSAYPWIFGDIFCVLRTVAAETSTNASILTITAFTVERYVAICHPLWIQAKCGLQRATRIILIIWIVSAVCSIPIDIQYGVVYLQNADGLTLPESATCNIRADRYIQHAFEMSTFLFFFAPMAVISALYGLIARTIRRSTQTRTYTDLFGSHDRATDLKIQHQAIACRAVIKMLVAVVVAFLICWAPFHMQRLMAFYVPSSDIDSTPALAILRGLLYYVSGVLYYVSSVINPILYNIMSLKFRQAFRNTVFRPFRRQKGRRPTSATYRFQSRPPAVQSLTG